MAVSTPLYFSKVQVTGSNLVNPAIFTGIGGTLVLLSGSQVLVSGAGGEVSLAQLNSLSGFTTGVSGYLQQQISMTSAGVTQINGISGSISLVGTRGIQVTQSGQTIFVSGQDWVTSGILAQSGAAILAVIQQTGSTLFGLITGLSGQAVIDYATKNQLTQTGVNLRNEIAQSGQQAWTAANNNAINLSGQLTITGQTLYNLIVISSGLFLPTGSILSYYTGIATGSDKNFFNFLGHTFAAIPVVVATLETAYGENCTYGFSISGRSTTGFWALWTDVISESGYGLNVIAKA